MKKVLLISNMVLLVAVIVLYYLYFRYTSTDSHRIMQANTAVANSFKIAYFDLDSLESQYQDYKEARDYLRGKDSEMTEQLNILQNNYISKVKEYQQKGPTMSQTEQSDFQDQLAKMRDDYQQTQQQMGQEMNAESMRKLQEVKNKIQSFLKDYCKDKGYAYVFASSSDDYLYYKDTLRNITKDIVGLLNQQHEIDKKH